ncbi:uncharacterized protein LOC128556405 isoform X2 [Mercenaria mercenaria]|uniref:uncharacterized protein LOC128556405 isoform X2 n=1 Tax=Mercenaria mercenaria TaxID=6596 RepID=UPI00234E7839|nr:uncharacterized protein LOC128556405 isoform X2 [Mercenaria mercenaria]
MKISFLYPCAVFILYCTVLKVHVCAECYQEKCQLLSVTYNLILLDPFLCEHFGSLYFKIKNGSGRMSKTDCLNVKKECVWTCDSNTHGWCRKCKKEYCKQQTPGDFCGCIHADAFYPFETFEQYMKSNYDRRSEFGSSNLTSDSHYECCKRRTCGSAEDCTIGERLHEKEPSDKLLSSLELSLVISFIATVASLCSILFVFVIWSYSHPRRDEHSQKHEHTTPIPSNGLRLQRQRRRKRQNKNLNRVSKQTDNDTTEKNVHGSFNQNNNEATKQYVNKESKLNDHKVLEQSENCTVLLSAHREVSSTLNSVICVSQSQQTENPAAVSENEWCTSATRVKQYKFSHEAKYISQKEKTETEDCSEHSGNSIEIERVIIPLSVQEGLFENNDSSGKSAEFDSETTTFPKFCGQSSAKQTHECSQNSIEDVKRQLVAKEISRELHIEHRNLTIFGLDSYFDRLNNGPPPTTRERMQYEWIRLASFHNYTGNGNALALARNGFYHDHNEGPMSTRCYLCEARRSDWEMFDDISAEHRRQSPNCPFHDNREEETLNISITNGDNSETPARSSRSSIGSSLTSSVTSSSSMSTGAATVREVSSSFQGINISQTNIGNSGGESIPLQPTEDPESRDRSLLALSQPRTQRALGRTGHSYSTIIAPRRNNVATGAHWFLVFSYNESATKYPPLLHTRRASGGRCFFRFENSWPKHRCTDFCS